MIFPDDMEQVTFHTNVIKGGQKALPIMVAYGIGMTLMFTLIGAGANTVITIVVMLIAMYLAVALLVYKGKYTLDDSGIREIIVPIWSPFGWRKPEEHFFEWHQVKAYKITVDASVKNVSFQQIGQKVILEIYFHHTPYKVIFNNGKTPDSRNTFGNFVDAFLSKVETINKKSQPGESGESPAMQEILHHDHPMAPMIERKRSFYEKPVAKLVTLVFVAFTLGLIYVMMQGYGSATSWFKLLFILVPGTAYMCYRVFYNPRFDR